MTKKYYYHKKICLCQKCKGLGLITVQGEKKLIIEPYVPGNPTTSR